jgi:hypothetical protein
VVINVGAPFNSGYDDVFYILAEDVGYFSSNRTGTEKNYDMYEFSLQEATPGYEAMNEPD